MEELEERGNRLVTALEQHGIRSEMSEDDGFIGGGSLPGEVLKSRVVEVGAADLEKASAALRCGEPAVVPRVADDRLIFDLRTLGAFDPQTLAEAVARAINNG